MIVKENKNQIRKKRHLSVRSRVVGSASRPRLNVFRSTSHIYAQIIDDAKGITLTSSSTIAKDINIAGLNKSDSAKEVGRSIAKKALELGVKAVVFDRGGYLYTGRIKALADGAREAGLEF